MIKFRLIEQIDDTRETRVLIPKAQTIGSAGFDVRTTTKLLLGPGETIEYGTGICIEECKDGVFLIMELRSSLRFKKRCTQFGIGVIDTDYRGEIRGIIHNAGKEIVEILAGERIAQLIPMSTLVPKISEYIKGVERVGGIGSTGK